LAFWTWITCFKEIQWTIRNNTLVSKTNDYIFNLDNVRVPAKYPGKRHFKGDKKGLPSGNPLGKNPSDIWEIVANDWETAMWDIPNVKSNHPEKQSIPVNFQSN